MRRVAAAWAASVLALELSPETLLVARIKTRMLDNQSRLPNYTCLQTIERSYRRAPARKFELLDTLRLEVALVTGKELFSWPGSARFEDRELKDLVGGGAIGNGTFALHARSVFLSSAPTYTYVGRRERDGRQTERFDYRVPQLTSGYKIRVGPREAFVGYHGSFWVDATSLDLIRLEVHADDIPPHLGLDSAGDWIEYERARIGDGEFLLPRASELTMTDLAGNESRNRTLFASCRQYSGESVLSFAEPVEASATPEPPALVRFELPAGLGLELELETSIDLRRAAVGDPVVAVVRGDAKLKGSVVVPRGARVSGRLARLEKWPGRSRDSYAVRLRFHTLEFDNRQARFLASLEGVSAFLGSLAPPSGRPAPDRGPDPDAGGDLEASSVGMFYYPERAEVPKGFRMYWRTGLKTRGEKQ